MIDIIDGFKPCGKQKKKNQIILAHSSRSVGDYLQSLKLRFNGKFKRIPNYIVTRDGQILQLLGNNEHSNYFTSPNINRNSIIICLENLGWLEKEPLSNHYVNWIGDIYKGNVFEKKWRDYYFWQPYTSIQVENTSILCSKLLKEIKIKNQVIGHNTKINGIEKYDGIVSKSNFDTDYTDVSPAFNFEEFLKKIEHEQFT
jgi:N-acetyl-anhydromuramyl-L-alanine amidase AmpD